MACHAYLRGAAVLVSAGPKRPIVHPSALRLVPCRNASTGIYETASSNSAAPKAKEGIRHSAFCCFPFPRHFVKDCWPFPLPPHAYTQSAYRQGLPHPHLVRNLAVGRRRKRLSFPRIRVHHQQAQGRRCALYDALGPLLPVPLKACLTLARAPDQQDFKNTRRVFFNREL
jgi:hypothetical protein